MSPPPAEPAFSDDQKAAFSEYFDLFDRLRPQLEASLQGKLSEIPELLEVMKRTSPQQLQANSERAKVLQRQALKEGNWKAYLEDLRQQGATYAQGGISFRTWFKLTTAYRALLRELLLAESQDSNRNHRVLEAMNVFLDISLAEIGEGYLTTKEKLIGQQQEAIRELSTPVLQVRDRLLIIPVIGLVDTRRARHLTQSMLAAIRERRARAVVMDITGVPIVDSKVANHLAQACEAARLMGARVILTGVSAEIAQAMVTIGAELRGVETLGDLQTGIEEAERQLGYLVAHDGSAVQHLPPPPVLGAGG